MLLPWGLANTVDGFVLITRGSVDFKSNPTLAAGDVKISIDGGTFTNLGTLPTVTPSSNVGIRIALSASECECTHAVVAFIDQTNPKEWEDAEFKFHTPKAEGAVVGKITSGTPSTTSFVSSQLTGANTDQYKDGWFTFLSGTCVGATKKCTAFNASTDTVTCDALPAAPAVGDVFIFVNGA